MKLRSTTSKLRHWRLPITLALASSFLNTHCGGDDPAPVTGNSGKGGTSGSSGTSGTSATGGSAGSGGSSGSSGSAAGGSAGTANADSGIDASDSGGDGEAPGNPDANDAAEDVFVDKTVRGTLKTPRGRPLEGLTVLIGQSTTVSNARGEFTVDNVPPTYDLLVLPNASKGAASTHLYTGLSTRRPTARIAVTDTFLRTTVQGSLSPEYPQQDLQRTGVGFKAGNQEASAAVILAGGQGPTFGPFEVAWTFDTAIAGQLFALRWSVGTTQFPTGYRGWVAQPVSLASGSPASVNLVLGTVTQREITGTTRFPQEIRSLTARLDVESITVFDNPVAFASGATSVPYAYPIPTGVGGAARVLAFRATFGAGVATSELRTAVVDTSSTIDFELPLAPSPALPVDRATGVDTNTEFSWTAVPNAVYRLGIVSATTGAGVVIHTAATNGKIPDLASKGVPLASGNHLWAVEAAGPADTVDAFVTGSSILEQRGRELSAFSQYRNFTTRTP